MEILRPIIFLLSGRSGCPQTAALLEVKAIFRRSIRNLPPALALTGRRSFGSGSVPSIVCPAGFHSLPPTFALNASQHRAWPLCSAILAAPTSMVLTEDLRLGCFIFISGRLFREKAETIHRRTQTHCERFGNNGEIRSVKGYRADETVATGSFSRSCSLR